ncbi:MAG: hypothetical protein KGJ32_06920, partial [Xanthomonadaceae bacterium]|nr:hypothetical protein [Xanthomonadaceae bacterium]
MPDEAAPAVAAGSLGRPLGRPRARAAARRPRRRLWLISPEGFRELRHSCLLSQRQAAAYLGVCLRTVRHWDSGRNRVPWSAVRLLRLLRAGELGGLLDGWEGWRIVRDRLVSPEGRVYRERDMRHWWLTLEQARFWREGYDVATLPSAAQPREATGRSVTQAGRAAEDAALPSPAAPAPLPTTAAPLPRQTALKGAQGTAKANQGRTGSAAAEPPRSRCALGLVSYATSDSSGNLGAEKRPLREGGNGVAAPSAGDSVTDRAGIDVTSERRQSD